LAYTLKASGIATSALCVVAVDEDGTTIKEFVSSGVNTNKTVGAAVSIGTSTWKSTSRKYIQTVASSTGGIAFGAGNRPLFNAANISFFLACENLEGAAFLAGAFADMEGTGGSADPRWGRNHDDDHIAVRISAGYRVSGTVQPATNTKFSCGTIVGSSAASHYALESSAGSARTTTSDAADTAYTLNNNLFAIGGGGTDFSAARVYLFAVFTGALSGTNWENLHDDPWSTLFDSGGGSGIVGGSLAGGKLSGGGILLHGLKG
jgi:hypothetical protein